MVCVGKHLKDNFIPVLLPGADILIRQDCSKPHPTWPSTLPGMWYPQFLWATCASALHPLISNLNLPSVSSKLFHLSSYYLPL